MESAAAPSKTETVTVTAPAPAADPAAPAPAADPAHAPAKKPSPPPSSLSELFLKEFAFEHHLNLHQNDRDQYVCMMLLLVQQGLIMTQATKVRILCTLWKGKEYNIAHYLLTTHSKEFGFAELLKAVTLLDSARRLRALEKKLARFEAQKTAKPDTKKKLLQAIHDIKLVSNQLPLGVSVSVTGVLLTWIRKWVNSLKPETLEFYALNFPTKPWQELADVVHLRTTDFTLPWFLQFVYGAAPPEDSVVYTFTKKEPKIAEEFLAAVLKFKPPYSFIRKKAAPALMTEAVKRAIGEYETLTQLIWYHEELNCPSINEIIGARIAKGERPDFSYGKLLERLLYLRSSGAKFYEQLVPVAQSLLATYNLPLEPPVAILADASGSMQVSIKVAAILSSMLADLCKADLKFFNAEVIEPPFVPSTITQVFQLVNIVKAYGNTNPASALWSLYERKQIVKILIVISDEDENAPYQDTFFAPLLKKYQEEVYPCKVMLVSFLTGNTAGPLQTELEDLGIKPVSFKLNKDRPDLMKSDLLLSLLVAESSFLQHQIAACATYMRVTDTLKMLSMLPEAKSLGHYFPCSLLLKALSASLSAPHSPTQHPHLIEVLTKLHNFASALALSSLDSQIVALLNVVQAQTADKVLPAEVLANLQKALAEWQGMYDAAVFKRLVHESAPKPPPRVLTGAAGEKKPATFRESDAVAHLDLAFVVDNTGSMSSYIEEVKRHMKTIIGKIREVPGCSVRFGLVCYRDHPPQDSSYVTSNDPNCATRVHPFTTELAKMQQYVDSMAASGGGDAPEAVACGLEEVSRLAWKEEATKVVIFVADAPPHGLEDSDGFPGGCPCGHDPLLVTRRLAARGVLLYSVGCEPAINHYAYTSAFMRALCRISEGRYIPLKQAEQLPMVIIGSAIEELTLDRLRPAVRKELEALEAMGVYADDDALLRELHRRLVAQGVRTTQLRIVDNSVVQQEYVLTLMKAVNFPAAKAKLREVRIKVGGGGGGGRGGRGRGGRARPARGRGRGGARRGHGAARGGAARGGAVRGGRGGRGGAAAPAGAPAPARRLDRSEDDLDDDAGEYVRPARPAVVPVPAAPAVAKPSTPPSLKDLDEFPPLGATKPSPAWGPKKAAAAPAPAPAPAPSGKEERKPEEKKEEPKRKEESKKEERGGDMWEKEGSAAASSGKEEKKHEEKPKEEPKKDESKGKEAKKPEGLDAELDAYMAMKPAAPAPTAAPDIRKVENKTEPVTGAAGKEEKKESDEKKEEEKKESKHTAKRAKWWTANKDRLAELKKKKAEDAKKEAEEKAKKEGKDGKTEKEDDGKEKKMDVHEDSITFDQVVKIVAKIRASTTKK